jgi:hypothetical protein
VGTDLLVKLPSIPWAILRTNTIVSDVVASQLPEAKQYLEAGLKSTMLDAGNLTLTFSSHAPYTRALLILGAVVHMHWLAISGAAGLLANILNLIPMANTSGTSLNDFRHHLWRSLSVCSISNIL